MAEMIDIFTKQGEKIGTISKEDYYSWSGENLPWINCITCFVINDENKKILFEKRGKSFLDPGKLDLCSGHVRSGEIPMQGMVRELEEELSIDQQDSQNLHFLGKMDVDYTTLQDEANRKALRCFVTVYALRMRDIKKIKIDNIEAINMGFLDFEDAIGFIQNGMTRMPYEEGLEKQYSQIFQRLQDYIFPRDRSYELEVK